jgi:hypothetical protein
MNAITRDYVVDCDAGGCHNSTPPQPGPLRAQQWATEHGWSINVNGRDYCPQHNQIAPPSADIIFNPIEGEMIEWNIKQPEYVRVR